MKKTYVITNQPTKLPILGTVVYTFLMDYYNASDFWWGVFILGFSIIWIIFIISLFNEEKIDLNKDYSTYAEKRSILSNFAQKLEKIINEHN